MTGNNEPKNFENIFNIQLIFTEECNLRCKYCFEIDKGSRKMPLELAKDILTRELSSEEGKDEYQIDLVGGEPFLLFDEIKDIVAYARFHEAEWKRKFFFYIGTNLTLLTPEIKQWLEENKGYVYIATSLDGTRGAHNLYRCDSYDNVVGNLPFYRKLYPNQGVKMTIGADTIGCIYDSILNIESLGIPFVAANVVYEPVWGDVENKKKCLREFSHQLELLINHYANNPELSVTKLLALPIHKIVDKQDGNYRWCGSGINMRAYDTDGRELPCHRFSRFSANKIYNGAESVEPRISTKCDSCMYIRACPTCRGYNWQVNNNPDSRTTHHCEFIKLQLLATAKLQYLLNKHIIESLHAGEAPGDVPPITLRSLKAAKLIFDNLDEDRIIEECMIG